MQGINLQFSIVTIKELLYNGISKIGINICLFSYSYYNIICMIINMFIIHYYFFILIYFYIIKIKYSDLFMSLTSIENNMIQEAIIAIVIN